MKKVNNPIFSRINELAETIPFPALLSRQGGLSFSALRSLIFHVGETLERKGVGPGDRVAYAGGNHPIVIILHLSCILKGYIFVPLNALLEATLLSQLAKDCAPVFILKEDFEPFFPEFLAAPSNVGPLQCPPREATAIYYTSGTTGQFKGVTIYENHLWKNICASSSVQKFSPGDKIIAHLNFSHSGGMYMQTLPGLLSGATVILNEFFSPESFAEQIRLYRPQHTILLPGQLGLLKRSRYWKDLSFKTFHHILTGSHNVPATFVRDVVSKGGRVLNVYGLTEAGPFSLYKFLDAAPPENGPVPIGNPVEGLQVRLEGGDEGEIQLKGDTVFRGYWDHSPSPFTGDGWMKTGDYGKRKGEDYYFVSKIHDLINIGGDKMDPHALEAELLRLLPLEECVVFPIPHKDMGQIIGTLLVPSDADTGPEALKRIRTIISAHLPKFRRPHKIILRGSVPRNANGKPDRLQCLNLLRRET